MNLSIIPIDNFKGIRLNKTIIEKYDFKDEVELILEDDQIIIKPKSMTKSGWERAFEKMHANGDDKLLLPDVFEEENMV